MCDSILFASMGVPFSTRHKQLPFSVFSKLAGLSLLGCMWQKFESLLLTLTELCFVFAPPAVSLHRPWFVDTQPTKLNCEAQPFPELPIGSKSALRVKHDFFWTARADYSTTTAILIASPIEKHRVLSVSSIISSELQKQATQQPQLYWSPHWSRKTEWSQVYWTQEVCSWMQPKTPKAWGPNGLIQEFLTSCRRKLIFDTQFSSDPQPCLDIEFRRLRILALRLQHEKVNSSSPHTTFTYYEP